MEVIINGEIAAIPAQAFPVTKESDFFINLLLSLGYNLENLPLGDFLAQYHGLKGEWVVADPVYWEALHNDAMILAFGKDLELTGRESHQLLSDLTQFLKTDEILTHYHDKSRWLLEKSNKTAINAKPSLIMRHQSLMPAFNAMDSSLYWQQLMTELQMFLSNHDLNETRKDKPMVNGIWIYGEGVFRMPLDVKMLTDDERLIKQFPESFEKLEASSKLDSSSCLVLTHKDSLPESLPNIPMLWRWNNMTYQTKKTSIWMRLWRLVKR